MTNQHTLRRAVAALGLATLLALTGCSGPSSQSAPDAGGANPEAGAPATPGSADRSDASPAERQVARTATLTVRVDDHTAAAAEVRRIAESLGGYLGSESISTPTDARRTSTSTVVIHVPTAKLDAALDEAAKIGEVTSRVVTAKDVTAQVVDTEARIRTLRESIERVRQLMDKAGSIGDIARVEAELTSRQSELESMLAQREALKNQVETAPVTVRLVGTAAAENPLMQGLRGGWEALQASVRALLVFLGAVLPFAVLGALIAAPIVWWRRRHPRPRTPARPAPRPAADDDAAIRPASDRADGSTGQGDPTP